MTPYRWTITATLMAAICLYGAGPVAANNLRIANATIIAPESPDGTAQVRFDISWENSWRYAKDADDKYYHDAAWLFFKVRPTNGNWQHVILESAGHSTGDADGTPIELSVPTDRMGVFIRRSGDGAGTLARTNVTVKWNLADSGISASRSVEVRACGVEMVYVAQGAFWAGDKSTTPIHAEYPPFSPTWINTAIATNTPISIGNGEYAGGYPYLGGVGLRPASGSWPNGYNAFYCMKHEITQGQYADFLNSITKIQSEFREATIPVRRVSSTFPRYTISGVWPNFVASKPDRACPFLSWADGVAFASWAGLRPMTGVEYEKACRGPERYVDGAIGEHAWGTTNIIADASLGLSGTENGTETVTNDVSLGAAVYGNNVVVGGDASTGPLRVGIFATNGATRVTSGASYWGIMELTGNLKERMITIFNATGRSFTGRHGNGVLNEYGEASVTGWPGQDQVGSGSRGGSYSSDGVWYIRYLRITELRISRDTYVDQVGTYHYYRVSDNGWRGVRTAP